MECGLALLEFEQGRRNQGCRRWDFGRYFEPFPKGGTSRPLYTNPPPLPLPNFQTFLRPCLNVVPPIADQWQYNSACHSALEESQGHLKLSKSRKQFKVSSILPKKHRTKLTILRIFCTQDSKFCSFFGRIEDTKIFFRDCLTFKATQHIKVLMTSNNFK